MSSIIDDIYIKKPNSLKNLNYNLNHLSIYPEWNSLIKELNLIKKSTHQQLLSIDNKREENFVISASGIELNYSKQPITKTSMQKLLTIAEKYDLKTKINDLFSGRIVNKSEHRPALHTALRSNKHDVILVNNKDINCDIWQTISEMETIANKIRNNQWFEYPVTDVVNIGIGGSDLGPKMATDALKNHIDNNINYHFISDNDPDNIEDIINKLKPKSTIFIVASKSFKTFETISNLAIISDWLKNNNCNPANHIIAITANYNLATQFSIKHILPIWDYIGGRFSFFSAINLILMIAIGHKKFHELLLGAREMDNHFRTTDFANNLPVVLALLGVWNINFFNATNYLLLIYSKRLNHLVPFVQQMDMESNGKNMTNTNTHVNYLTSPIVWGGPGNQAEHAYYQLLMQGTHYSAIDYILVDEEKYEAINYNANKKLNILANNSNKLDIFNQSRIRSGINKITLKKLDPMGLGSLVALYEHKTYIQSLIWQINAFDQPGVDALKALL